MMYLVKIPLAVLVFSVLFILSGCREDEAEPEPQIENVWEVEKVLYYKDGTVTSSRSADATIEIKSYVMLPCEGTKEKVEITEEIKVSYAYYTLSSEGGLLLNVKTFEKRYAPENSECEIAYRDGIYFEDREGYWSYDEETKILTLAILQQSEPSTYYSTHVALIRDGRLIITDDFENENRIENVLKVKK